MAQGARRQARPIWFAQKLPRQQHHVRAAIADDLVRVRGFGDAAVLSFALPRPVEYNLTHIVQGLLRRRPRH